MLDALAIEPLTIGLVLFALLVVATFLVSASTSRRSAEDKLRLAGFHADGEGFVCHRDGIELRATLSRPDTHLWLMLVGSPNASRAPTFRAATPGPHPHQVVSGDPAFDAAVLAEHPREHEGLAWLDADLRGAVRDAVALPARVVEGRWRYRAICSGALDVAAAADTLALACAASCSDGVSIEEGLEALARQDPEPRVRARAIEALAERGTLRPELVSLLVDRPDPGVQLALVRDGGIHAIRAWRTLAGTSDTQRRAQGAIALARHIAQGRFETGQPPLDDVVAELLTALDEPTQAHWVSEALEGLDPPDLLRRLLDRFGEDLPRELHPLVASLRDARRPSVRGGVSLARAEGGGVAVAETPRPEAPALAAERSVPDRA